MAAPPAIQSGRPCVRDSAIQTPRKGERVLDYAHVRVCRNGCNFTGSCCGECASRCCVAACRIQRAEQMKRQRLKSREFTASVPPLMRQSPGNACIWGGASRTHQCIVCVLRVKSRGFDRVSYRSIRSCGADPISGVQHEYSSSHDLPRLVMCSGGKPHAAWMAGPGPQRV